MEWGGDHRVQVWWRSSHVCGRRSDLRKVYRQTDGQTDRETDGRRTPRDCISSFQWNELKWNELIIPMEWANNNKNEMITRRANMGISFKYTVTIVTLWHFACFKMHIRHTITKHMDQFLGLATQTNFGGRGLCLPIASSEMILDVGEQFRTQWHRSKTLSSHRSTVRDGVLKLGYTSVIFVDMGAKFDGTYCCDLLLSQQLLPVICHVSSEFVF